MKNIFLIASGGAIGATLRYLVYQFFDKYYHKYNFPLGTLAVNLIGSFLIGLALGLSIKYSIMARHSNIHYFFVTGLLGAFTTFSAFSQDNLILIFEKKFLLFGTNAFANLFLGLLFCYLGYLVIQKLFLVFQ